jgi:hypothetical protein
VLHVCVKAVRSGSVVVDLEIIPKPRCSGQKLSLLEQSKIENSILMKGKYKSSTLHILPSKGRPNDEAGASLYAGSTFQEDSSSHGHEIHCESASEEIGGGGGGGGVIANEQLQQVSERLKQVLDAEMRSRGLSGFDLASRLITSRLNALSASKICST